MRLGNSRRLWFCLVAVSLPISPGLAQRVTPPQQTVTASPATRPVNATTRPAPVTTRPTTAPLDQLSLNFKDAPLDSVLDYLSEAGGFVIVREGPVDGRVTLLSRQPVSRQEAVAVLNAALNANGLAAIQMGRELKIMPRDKARRASIPVRFGADPNDMPITDELVTQVIPIRNMDAVKLRDDLKPMIAVPDDVAANQASNTIVMTDTSANIHRLARIIQVMDQQEATTSDMRLVTLHHANASSAVKLIDAIFKPDDSANRGPQPGQPMMMPPQPGQPQPGGAGGAQRVRGHVVAAADDRTNIIVVTGPSDLLKIVDEILRKLDADPVPAAQVRWFPLRYADAESLSKLIRSIYQPPDQNNDVPFFFRVFNNNDQQNNKVHVTTAFDDRTNTLIVTAPVDVMKDIQAMVTSLDANPVAASDIRVFPLKYADSYSAAKLINSVFNPTAEDNGSRRFIPIFIYDGGGTSEQQAKGAKVNATSDDRSNSVIVTAPVESMKIVEQIIRQIDSSPGSEDTLFIYHLRNAQASNLETVLNTLFGNIQNGQNQNNQNNNQQQNQNNGGGFGNMPGGGANNRGLGSNGQAARNPNRNNTNRANRPQLQPGMAQAVNELTGQVLVVADQDTNSLLVTTAVKYQRQVKAIIAELDHPIPQVEIKVLVAEVTHDNNADFGADFSILNTRPNGNGQSFGQTFGNPGSGLVVNFLENNLNAQLHALAQQNKLDVLSRPYILASDNQLAEIVVGQDVPIITSSSITAFGQTISNIEYQKVGIILDVTPHINPDGQVIMDVAPEISQLTAQTVNAGQGVNVPVIADRSATSRVGIMDGHTIVIGGLMQDQKTLTINKIPLIGDIPVIGKLFSRTEVDKTKTELLIFLTPHVALQPDVLNPMSQEEMKGTRLTPDAVAPGTFDEHIKGMRLGGSTTTRPSNPSPVYQPEPGDAPPETRPASPEVRPAVPDALLNQR